jgi:hypothetical protein
MGVLDVVGAVVVEPLADVKTSLSTRANVPEVARPTSLIVSPGATVTPEMVKLAGLVG